MKTGRDSVTLIWRLGAAREVIASVGKVGQGKK